MLWNHSSFRQCCPHCGLTRGSRRHSAEETSTRSQVPISLGLKCPKCRQKSLVSTISQCCGSMTFWHGSASASLTYGSDPAFCVSGWQDNNKKEVFFDKFLLITFEGTFTFKNKKYKRSDNIVEIKGFLTFFACFYKDLEPDPERLKNKRILQIRVHSTALNSDNRSRIGKVY